MSATPDPRRLPFRPDLADIALKNRVEAAHFVTPQAARITQTVSDLLASPDAGARISQALFGERFDIVETRDGWCWGALHEGRRGATTYVGWVRKAALIPLADGPPPTHRVIVPLTHAGVETIKTIGCGPLPMGALIACDGGPRSVRGSSAPFLDTGLGTVPESHLLPLPDDLMDAAGVAETFHHSPYVWGGRTAMGLDCSALVQLSLDAIGKTAPRDSDMQEAEIGMSLEADARLKRGDLVFWRGHVGMMLDETRLIHANAYHMRVAIEPLAVAEARILAGGGGAITARKRP